MNKLLFLSVFFPISLSAQSLWPHQNAEWWSEITYFLFLPAEQHHYVAGDTLIEGISCTIHRTDHIYAYPNEPGNVQVFNVQEEYLYFNGDTVFWWKENEFRILLCFNAQPGDSWFPLPPEGYHASCDSIPVTVSEVDSVQYDGIWYRRIFIENPEGGTGPYFWGGYFDERTFRKYGFFPEYNLCDGVVEWLQFNFRCYTDGELTITGNNNYCGSILLSAEYSLEVDRDIHIYPNPLKSGESLFVGDVDEVEILMMNGVSIWKGKSALGKINPQLKPGLYFVVFKQNGYLRHHRLVAY